MRLHVNAFMRVMHCEEHHTTITFEALLDYPARARQLKKQNIGITTLDYTNLSSAIKQQQREQITKETYSNLRLIYDHVSKIASTNESPKQIHPNIQDTKTTIQAYYILNDIILGMLVEDRVEKEINAFTATLENLSKKSGIKININELKNTIDKIGIEQEKENAIEESRTLFRKQLKDFKKTETNSFNKPPYPSIRHSTLLRAKKILKLIHTNVRVRVQVLFEKINNRTKQMDKN